VRKKAKGNPNRPNGLQTVWANLWGSENSGDGFWDEWGWV